MIKLKSFFRSSKESNDLREACVFNLIKLWRSSQNERAEPHQGDVSPPNWFCYQFFFCGNQQSTIQNVLFFVISKGCFRLYGFLRINETHDLLSFSIMKVEIFWCHCLNNLQCRRNFSILKIIHINLMNSNYVHTKWFRIILFNFTFYIWQNFSEISKFLQPFENIRMSKTIVYNSYSHLLAY